MRHAYEQCAGDPLGLIIWVRAAPPVYCMRDPLTTIVCRRATSACRRVLCMPGSHTGKAAMSCRPGQQHAWQRPCMHQQRVANRARYHWPAWGKPEVLAAKDGVRLVENPAAAGGPLRVVNGHGVGYVGRQSPQDQRQQHPAPGLSQLGMPRTGIGFKSGCSLLTGYFVHKAACAAEAHLWHQGQALPRYRWYRPDSA